MHPFKSATVICTGARAAPADGRQGRYSMDEDTVGLVGDGVSCEGQNSALTVQQQTTKDRGSRTEALIDDPAVWISGMNSATPGVGPLLGDIWVS